MNSYKRINNIERHYQNFQNKSQIVNIILHKLPHGQINKYNFTTKQYPNFIIKRLFKCVLTVKERSSKSHFKSISNTVKIIHSKKLKDHHLLTINSCEFLQNTIKLNNKKFQSKINITLKYKNLPQKLQFAIFVEDLMAFLVFKFIYQTVSKSLLTLRTRSHLIKEKNRLQFKMKLILKILI